MATLAGHAEFGDRVKMDFAGPTLYIADSETPNALTADTIRRGRKGEDVFHASSPSDLFKQLGI